VSRQGGDEFIVLLSEISQAAGKLNPMRGYRVSLC
jgi:GGDEF domain-containing protein